MAQSQEKPSVPGGPARRRGPFRSGEWVQLTDEKGRVHTTLLRENGYFQCHQGALHHREIIGKPEGTIVPAERGEHRFTALRPLLVLDASLLLREVHGRGISMCGALPAALGVMACRALDASHAHLCAHDTSAAASGDTRRVVGYASALVW